MADEITSQPGTSAPAVQAPTPAAVIAPPAPVAAPVAPPAPEAPKIEREVRMPTEAFNERLASAQSAARNALLKELGITDPKEVQALLAEKHAREEATKSAEQRAAEKEAALVAERQRVESLLATVRARSEVEMGALTDAQKQAVLAIAGDDPAKRLAAIDALLPTWKTAAPVSVSAPVTPPAPVAPPAPPPPAPPATTAPARGAPPDGQTVIVDHKAEYARLREINPFVAAQYANSHPTDIYGPGIYGPAR